MTVRFCDKVTTYSHFIQIKRLFITKGKVVGDEDVTPIGVTITDEETATDFFRFDNGVNHSDQDTHFPMVHKYNQISGFGIRFVCDDVGNELGNPIRLLQFRRGSQNFDPADTVGKYDDYFEISANIDDPV